MRSLGGFFARRRPIKGMLSTSAMAGVRKIKNGAQRIADSIFNNCPLPLTEVRLRPKARLWLIAPFAKIDLRKGIILLLHLPFIKTLTRFYIDRRALPRSRL